MQTDDSDLEFCTDAVKCELLSWQIVRDAGWNGFVSILNEVPDPAMAISNLLRILRELPPETDSKCIPDIEKLLFLLSSSQYLADILIRKPELLSIISGYDFHAKAARAKIAEAIAGAKTRTERMAILRSEIEIEKLIIGFGDLCHAKPITWVTGRLSDLADAALNAAIEPIRAELNGDFGVPRDASGGIATFSIIAMGKLGGRELNYSSDIDLIFVYSADGGTTGGNKGTLSNGEFFSRLGERLRLEVGGSIDLGHAFRVDLRLRPEGSAGQIARSLASTIQYYYNRGETWERQALIKARRCAGDREPGETLIRELHRWIYRAFLDTDAIQDIKRLKRRTEEAVSRRGELNLEVKLGRGGIRDIEFITQYIQLCWGSRYPGICHPGTLDAISGIASEGLISRIDAETLVQAYVFWRKIEHRLQLMFSVQTHTIPDDKIKRARLAARMGFSSMRALVLFDEEIERHSSAVREITERIVFDPFESSSSISDLILDPNPSNEKGLELLSGFENKKRALKILLELPIEESRFLRTEQDRRVFAELAPTIISEVLRTPDPDSTFINFANIVRWIGARKTFFQLLLVHTGMRRLVLNICSWSRYLTEIIAHNPGLMDQLVDSLATNEKKTYEMFHVELSELVAAATTPSPLVHGYRNQEVLRIGIRDITGRSDAVSTMNELSDLAMAVLAILFDMAQRKLKKDFPCPKERFACLALGKFGDRELSYASDLDIIILFEGETDAAGMNHQAMEYYERIAQEFRDMSERHTVDGRLYTIDFRLRPEGKSNTLTLSLKRFYEYHSKSAQLWERQALSRAAWVAGSGSWREVVEQAVNEIVFERPLPPDMAAQMAVMRQKVERHSPQSDYKRGAGGMQDIEFLAQYVKLVLGQNLRDLRRANTIEVLEHAGTRGMISAEDAATLLDSYRFFRTLENRMYLSGRQNIYELPTDEREANALAVWIGMTGGDVRRDLAERLVETRNRVRGIWEKTFGLP